MKGGDRMSKTIKVLLLLILVFSACLSPVTLSNSPVQDLITQKTWADNSLSALEIIPLNIKNNFPSNNLPFAISVLFIFLFALFPPRSNIKEHIVSFIPIIKILYVLYPIKYKSRYLVNSLFYK
jgi:hypothetical protein